MTEVPSNALAAARVLLAGPSRSLLGIAGAPGSGKTTLAASVVAALEAERPGQVAHVPMDGFHLADVTLAQHGSLTRKGAPETFDGWGYLALLRRLRAAPDHPVFAPGFERDLEQPLAGAIEIGPDVGLVVTEGNYLLLDDRPWSLLGEVLDAIWFCDADEDRRTRALVARHVRFGKTPEQAAAWVDSVDGANAALVARTRGRADRVVVTY